MVATSSKHDKILKMMIGGENMVDYFNKRSYKCEIADSSVENKKVHYCKNCESLFAGVCRYLQDENYK